MHTATKGQYLCLPSGKYQAEIRPTAYRASIKRNIQLNEGDKVWLIQQCAKPQAPKGYKPRAFAVCDDHNDNPIWRNNAILENEQIPTREQLRTAQIVAIVYERW